MELQSLDFLLEVHLLLQARGLVKEMKLKRRQRLLRRPTLRLRQLRKKLRREKLKLRKKRN